MKTSQSTYVTEQSETCTAISDWIQATQEFHCYYSKIGEILQDKPYALTASTTDKSRRFSNLSKLRQHMNDVLETLLSDMDNASEASRYVNNIGCISRTGKLMTHARLLKQINKKISQELVQFTIFQA